MTPEEARRRVVEPITELQLVLDPRVQAPHVVYVQTEDAGPSSERVLKLAEQLGVPLRGRRHDADTAGSAPVYFYRSLADPELASVRDAVATILAGFRPYPALAIDSAWNLVAANSSFALLTAGVAPHLRQLPINLLRLSLHPDGLAGRILNLPQWRFHVLRHLAEAAEQSGLASLRELHAELSEYPAEAHHGDDVGLSIPLRMRSGDQELTFLSTVTALNGSQPVAGDLSIEAFLPADQTTASLLHDLM